MLILSRKCGEEIVVGRDIRVCVLKVSRGRVRLGVVAPDGVKVLRQELLRRNEEELSRTPRVYTTEADIAWVPVV